MRPGLRRDDVFVGTLPALITTLLAVPALAEPAQPTRSIYEPFFVAPSKPQQSVPQQPVPQEPVPQGPKPVVDETVVTAEPPIVEPTPIDRIGSRETLTTEDVERIAPRNVNDVAQWLPGLSSRPYNGGDDLAPNFAIRGLPDDGLTEYLLTTIDGVPANPMPYGWTAFSYFPLLPGQIAGAELLKGGFSVRNGPNTVGGVLNFLTPEIPLDQLTTVKSSFGSNDAYSTMLSHGDTVGDFGYLVTAGFFGGDGFRDDGEFEAQSIDAKLRFGLGGEDYLAVHGGFFGSRHQRPGGLPLDAYDEDRFQNIRPENYHRGDRSVLDLTLHRDDGGNEFTEYYAWFSSTSNAIIGSTPFFTPTTFRENTYTQYFGALGLRQERQFEFAGLEHEIHWGVRALQEYLPSRKFVDSPIGGGAESVTLDNRSSYTTFAAHIDDTIRPTERLSINVGLRAEYVPIAETENTLTDEKFEDDFFAVLPAAGIAYDFDENVGLFGSYQQGFRAPQVWGFGVSTSPIDDNQDLDFERGESMELGVRWRPAPAVETSATVWRTVFDDVAISVDSVYQNLGKVEANGIDLATQIALGEFTRALEGFRVGAAITFQDSELTDAAVAANDGNQTPFAWEEKLTGYVEYQFADQWVANVNAYYVGESFADDANTVDPNPNGTVGRNPSRTIWGTGLARTIELARGGNMRIGIDVTNLFDEEWFLYSRIGGKLAGAPLQTYLTVELSF